MYNYSRPPLMEMHIADQVDDAREMSDRSSQTNTTSVFYRAHIFKTPINTHQRH